jgi:hypothetical protein
MELIDTSSKPRIYQPPQNSLWAAPSSVFKFREAYDFEKIKKPIIEQIIAPFKPKPQTSMRKFII